jgi:hypothetical protein
VPFSLMWGGFAVFWTVAADAGGAPLPFTLFGLPFFILGLYFILGRFVVKARRKRRTAYGPTEGRALVAIGTGSLSDSPLEHQPVVQRRSRDGKHLTVTFGRPAGGWTTGPDLANTGMELFGQGQNPLGFYDVADVSGLDSALRRVRR